MPKVKQKQTTTKTLTIVMDVDKDKEAELEALWQKFTNDEVTIATVIASYKKWFVELKLR